MQTIQDGLIISPCKKCRVYFVNIIKTVFDCWGGMQPIQTSIEDITGRNGTISHASCCYWLSLFSPFDNFFLKPVARNKNQGSYQRADPSPRLLPRTKKVGAKGRGSFMASLLGEDGRGYELAKKLESCGVWRSWLGEAGYLSFVPFLSSPSSWDSFMSSRGNGQELKSMAQLQLQLRARALLFDKAAVSLFLRSSPSPHSSRLSPSCNLSLPLSLTHTHGHTRAPARTPACFFPSQFWSVPCDVLGWAVAGL